MELILASLSFFFLAAFLFLAPDGMIGCCSLLLVVIKIKIGVGNDKQIDRGVSL